jgi:lysophospholipase L1-like esterase
MADFEEIIIALKEKFPNAKLCYIQMFLIDDTTIDNITLDESKKPEIRQRRDKLYEQIEIACNKWNVSYIDVSDKFINTGTKYRQDDWIHLKEEGYQLLIHYVLEKLKALI